MTASGATAEPLRTTAGSMMVALPKPPTGAPAVAFKTFGISMTVALRATGLVAFLAAGVRGATPPHVVLLPAVLLPHGDSVSATVTETHVLVSAFQVVPLLQTQMLSSSTAPTGHGTQAVPLKTNPSVQLDCGFNTFKGVVWTLTLGAVVLLPLRLLLLLPVR
jgi:hypothetical protein